MNFVKASVEKCGVCMAVRRIEVKTCPPNIEQIVAVKIDELLQCQIVFRQQYTIGAFADTYYTASVFARGRLGLFFFFWFFRIFRIVFLFEFLFVFFLGFLFISVVGILKTVFHFVLFLGKDFSEHS